jgi:hypothetical protein
VPWLRWASFIMSVIVFLSGAGGRKSARADEADRGFRSNSERRDFNRGGGQETGPGSHGRHGAIVDTSSFGLPQAAPQSPQQEAGGVDPVAGDDDSPEIYGGCTNAAARANRIMSYVLSISYARRSDLPPCHGVNLTRPLGNNRRIRPKAAH